MRPIGIVAALGAEARALAGARRVHGPPMRLTAGANVMVSGIGFDGAARAARALADAGATALVSWGTAGGLDPALRPGALVLPREVLADDGRRFAVEAAWRQRVLAALGPRIAPADGALLSRTGAIAGADAKSRAFRTSGAVAVDMESLAVATVAADRRLPLLVVRAIVDAAEDELPPAVVAASRGGPLRLGRLAAEVLHSPAGVLGLIRLARRFRAARRTLAAVAAAGLAAPTA